MAITQSDIEKMVTAVSEANGEIEDLDTQLEEIKKKRSAAIEKFVEKQGGTQRFKYDGQEWCIVKRGDNYFLRPYSDKVGRPKPKETKEEPKKTTTFTAKKKAETVATSKPALSLAVKPKLQLK